MYHQLYRIAVIILLNLFIFSNSYSQKITVAGVVNDTTEKKPLSKASVVLLYAKDTSLAYFTRTAPTGQYIFNSIDTGKYIMLVSYPRYADYMEQLNVLESGDLGMIALIPKARLLEEVVVRSGYGAMRFKGDTTEFVADSFRVREGATVEDLLRKLPTLSVNSKGEVTAQGKTVDRVLVDGEEFFGNDPTKATKNIQASAVDKIQVYDTKSQADAIKDIGSGTGENKTINIQLKEDAKKGYFAAASAGGDLSGLYNTSALFNKFAKNEKVSFYVKKNNIDAGELDWQESESLGVEEDWEFDEFSGSYYSYYEGSEFSSYNLRGLPQALAAGANYGNKWNNGKHKANASYTFNRLYTKGGSNSENITYLTDKTLKNTTDRYESGLALQHGIYAKYEWRPDSLTTIVAKTNSSFSNGNKNSQTESTAQEGDQLLNTNKQSSSTESNSIKENYQVALTRNFKKKNRMLLANINYVNKYNLATNYLYSKINYYKNNVTDSMSIIDQLKDIESINKVYGSKLTFNEPITSKLNLVGEFTYNINKGTSHYNSFDKDSSGVYKNLNVENSNNFIMDARSVKTAVTLRYMGAKLKASAGVGVMNIRYELNNLDTRTLSPFKFNNFTPLVNIRYEYKKQQSIALNYSGNTLQPTIQQLQPLNNNSNPLYIMVGNPDLKVGFINNIGLSGRVGKTIAQSWLSYNINYSFTNNAITQMSLVDDYGKTTSMPVNVNGNQQWGAYLYYSKGGGWLEYRVNSNFYGGKNNNYLNGVINQNTYNYAGLRTSLGKSDENDKYSVDISLGAGFNNTVSSVTNKSTEANYWSYTAEVYCSFELPAGFVLRSDLESNLRQTSKVFDKNYNTIIWNGFIEKSFLKNKQLKLTLEAHDILNQQIGFSRSIQSNFMSQERYDRIARYVMLSAKYTINKTGTK